MEFFIGGYYLVEGTPIKKWMNHDLLPKQIFTPSSCICDLHPAELCLSWVNSDKTSKSVYRDKLKLTKSQFEHLQHEVDFGFESEKFGWPQVFIEVEEAQLFRKRWLSHLNNIKLIAIATTNQHREKFLSEEGLQEQNAGTSGNWLALNRKMIIEVEPGLLGFEVLGFELGGFHSFICNSLENDFSKVLKIQFNANGLIGDFKKAEQAATYAKNPKVGAEPALWQPWAIIEIPINT